MSKCQQCGNSSVIGRFCGQCGAALLLPEPPAPINSTGPTPVQSVTTTDDPSWSSQETRPDPGYWSGSDRAFTSAQTYGPEPAYGQPGVLGQNVAHLAGIEPPSPRSSGGRGKAIIAAAVAVLLIAGGVTWLVVSNSSSDTAAAGDNSNLTAFAAPPTVGAQIDLSEVFDHATTAAQVEILSVSSDAVTFYATGRSASDNEDREVVVGAADRTTGAVKWRVADKDLNPHDSTDGIFSCELTQTGLKIVCAQQESYSSSDEVTVDLTAINVADGTFTAAEAEGSFGYQANTVGDDALVFRSRDSSGGYDIVRVDSATGKDKWTSAITNQGDDFPGAHFENGWVQVVVTDDDGSNYSTELLNPDTGQPTHDLDGVVSPINGDYYGTLRTGSSSSGSSGTTSPGSQRVAVDGTIVWGNPDATLNSTDAGFSPTDPLLATEDEQLVGLDPSSGKVLWKSDRKFSGYVQSVSSGRAFFVDSEVVRVINLSNGDQIGTANGAIAGVGSEVFYTTDNGRLYAWDPATGKNLWRVGFHDLSPKLSSEADSGTYVKASGGVLFIGDGKFFAILKESS